MARRGTVNSQTTDSVALTGTSVLGQGPALSMDFAQVAMADSIGLVMQNAVTAQHNMQTITGAAVVQTCALVLSVGAAAAAKG